MIPRSHQCSTASAVAIGSRCLPVYEIYKAGEDLGWRPGLNLCAEIGLDLVVVPHWNNTDGGAELDTSRCFVGQERFGRLREMLPSSTVVLGLDEHTSCIVDAAAGTVEVRGQGSVTVLCGSEESVIPARESASLDLLRPQAGRLVAEGGFEPPTKGL